MADCVEYVEQMSCYLDGELSAEETETLFSHIAHCPDCAEALAALEELSALTKESLPVVPNRLANGVMAQLRAEKKRPVWVRYRFTVIAALFAVVVLAASSGPIARFFGTQDVSSVDLTTSANTPLYDDNQVTASLGPAFDGMQEAPVTNTVPDEAIIDPDQPVKQNKKETIEKTTGSTQKKSITQAKEQVKKSEKVEQKTEKQPVVESKTPAVVQSAAPKTAEDQPNEPASEAAGAASEENTDANNGAETGGTGGGGSSDSGERELAASAAPTLPETPYDRGFAIYVSFSASEPPQTLQAIPSDRTVGNVVYYIVSADQLTALLHELSTLDIPVTQTTGPDGAEGYLVILTLI